MQEISKISDLNVLVWNLRNLVLEGAKIYVPDLHSVDFLDEKVLNKKSDKYSEFIELLKENTVFSTTNSIENEISKDELSKCFVVTLVINPTDIKDKR